MLDTQKVNVLVVDDEEDLEFLVRRKFKSKVQEGKTELYFAKNGEEALSVLSKNVDIDVVLTDINMPVMDGLTFLSEMSKLYPIKKAIIVSAYGDMANIRTAMNRGAFDFVTKPVDFYDLEMTIEKTFAHVQQQKATVKAFKENNILKMFVDVDVINFMAGAEFEESLLRSEMANATVMFVDICKYTAISEQYPPDKVVSLLNKYFDMMVADIVKQDGHIDKFMGDCILAVFKGENHAKRAMSAAVKIRDSFNRIVEREMNDYRPQIAIGVNAGDMVMGSIGSQTLRRLDYTVIGDVVNTAQRLQSIAKPSQILTDHVVYEIIKLSFYCEEVGLVNLRNKAEMTRVYNVIKQLDD
ncbi:MAG: response regulator [Bacteroidetes bacterium]|nr:response regulator [Bacteroidota bacterium]NCQ11183.1 response regulator [Bacteroidota bacterium]